MEIDKKSGSLFENCSKIYVRTVCLLMSLLIGGQNLAFAAKDAFTLLRDMANPDPNVENNLPTPQATAEEFRLSLTNTMPRHMLEQSIALCLLARDVVANPHVAGKRFSADPTAYLAEKGLVNVKLDLTSREVKIVLALGDDAVREAASKGNAQEYLRLLESKGLLDIDSSRAIKTLDGNETPPDPDNPQMALFVAVAVTVAVAVSHAVALYTVVAEVNAAIHLTVLTYTYMKTNGVGDESENILNGLEGKMTALLWGKDMAREILRQHVSEKSEQWASAIENLSVIKTHKLSHDEIKKLIEKKLVEDLSN